MRTAALSTVLLVLALVGAMTQSQSVEKPTNETQFITLMRTIAEAWNEGNARKAADCFADNAVYLEPPDRQVYVGKEAIYAFFGGPTKPNPPMHMQWHRLAFNEREQVGFGEYTFQMNRRYHGIVTVQIDGGKIVKWREYQYQSNLDWAAFAGKSEF
jgi:hypothetical protein